MDNLRPGRSFLLWGLSWPRYEIGFRFRFRVVYTNFIFHGSWPFTPMPRLLHIATTKFSLTIAIIVYLVFKEPKGKEIKGGRG